MPGFATPTEAGIIAVFYALGVGIVYRTITWRGLYTALEETVEATALILYIIAVSSALSHIFISEGSASQLARLMASMSVDQTSFLLIANLLLLILGFCIETLPAMLIAVPLLLPTALTWAWIRRWRGRDLQSHDRHRHPRPSASACSSSSPFQVSVRQARARLPPLHFCLLIVLIVIRLCHRSRGGYPIR
jgi:hypothetical protein